MNQPLSRHRGALLTSPPERIRLLVHILCDLRASNGVTARRLEQAEQPIRRQISPAERLQLLDELYEVREAEEKFLDGVTGTYSHSPPYWSLTHFLQIKKPRYPCYERTSQMR